MDTTRLDSSVTVLRGVGDARAKSLEKLGIFTVRDLIRHYPRAYQNRGNTLSLYEIAQKLREGERGPFASILTLSSEPTVSTIRRGMTLVKARAFDETGSVEITFFNRPFMKKSLHVGEEYRFYGKFSFEYNRLKLASPICESTNSLLDGIVPVYPLTSGLTQNFLCNSVSAALDYAGEELTEFLPHDILSDLGLPSYSYTLSSIHRPKSVEEIENAKRRLTFDELLSLFYDIASSTGKNKKPNPSPILYNNTEEFQSLLPFEMTEGQKKALSDISSDMAGEYMMNRIVTGDVGSGKTAVAEGAAFLAYKNGLRTAVMVPTEILANQHYESFSRLFGDTGISVACLTGSTKKKERDRIHRGLTSDGDEKIDIIIGTHALISDGVEIEKLGLVVIDEQHRFGVGQRNALLEKSPTAHCLVMSATPIPRTLTLAIYGYLDISGINEMPKGRQKTDTFTVNETYRERLNKFIKKQAEEGHQTYVVCPAVDDAPKKSVEDAEELSDISLFEERIDTSTPLRSAVKLAEYLSSALPELRCEFVHGKMKPAEKEEIMSRFSRGEIDVLVSTTVIEVGVNVPNATLMIVENAERFGLAQLHQLRGRVGRGEAKSYFILVSDSTEEEAQKRLKAIKSTSNGFEIAEYDLQSRGPGDFFTSEESARQSGHMTLALASSCKETVLFEKAQYYAKREADSAAPNERLRKELERVSRRGDMN